MHSVSEAAHSLSLAILIGASLLFNVRIFGFLKWLNIDELTQMSTKIIRLAFVATVFTGLIVFLRNPDLLYNSAFRLKFQLLVLAALNMFIFRKRFPELANVLKSPEAKSLFGIRLHAGLFLVLWPLVALAGTWIAYV